MQRIADYEFDLNSTVYLLHPMNKFWAIKLDGTTVSFRIGKLKDGQEVADQVEEVEKTYPSARAARASVVTKIEEKLIKGYFSKEAVSKKTEEDSKNKAEAITIKLTAPVSKGTKSFSGEYYQKGKEALKIEVNGSKVKITRINDAKNEKFQIRTLGSHDEAVQFCMKEEQWAKNEGFVARSHKFVYSFVEDEDQIAPKSKRKDGKDERKGNFLSIIDMTDEAMSNKSRNVSSAKSDRSYADVSDGSFVPTKLGPPTSTCIKVLLAETYQEDTDPTGMIMSEKLDGVRCFWTGSFMYSRNGNRFFFPKFFTRNWPNSQLDGELFIDRGKFSQTLSAIKKTNPIDSEWENVRYLVFDCPAYKKPFKDRIKALEQVLGSIDNAYIKCHAHRVCNGFPDLFDELDKVNKVEGEGLMLRDPNALYENRRSTSLLKVKTFYDDEAEVLGYKAGTGRCLGMVGALRVRNTHGVQFEVGSGLTDDDRRRPPKIGTKITYKYQEFNKDSGKPRFPTYLRKYDKI